MCLIGDGAPDFFDGVVQQSCAGNRFVAEMIGTMGTEPVSVKVCIWVIHNRRRLGSTMAEKASICGHTSVRLATYIHLEIYL